jgi:predicted phage-related endonuclease
VPDVLPDVHGGAGAMSSRAAWLDWRRQGITATDVARAWTGKYGGAFGVVLEKRGEGAQEETAQMRRGRELETTVAAMVQLATGRFVAGEQTLAEHPEQPLWRATLDGFLLADQADDLAAAEAVFELKTTGVDVRPPWDYYRAQVAWQMLVSGFDLALIAVAWVDDPTMEIASARFVWQPRDDWLIAGLIQCADEIAQHLVAGTTPEPDGSDAATALVKAHTWTAEPEPEAIDLSEIADMVTMRQALKEQISEAEAELGRCDNVIRLAMDTAKRGTAGEWDVTYSAPRRKFNHEAALAAHPDYVAPTFDRERFVAEFGKGADDAFNEPIGSRVITIRRAKGTA